MQRCQATGCATGPADDEQRFSLLIALEGAATADAVARVRGAFSSRTRQAPTPRPPTSIAARRRALEQASHEWGARIASPSLVVEQLLLLRHLVATAADGERLGRLVDRAMLVATKAATDELQVAAFSDPLTGCANRRAFERDVERELARCARAELDLSVVEVDVDGLKRVNDTEGHAAGDRVLLLLVETLRRALRTLDGVYRLGGDEFAVVLPDTSPEDVAVVMARVEGLGAPAFSWGVASYVLSGARDAAALAAVADEDLYDRRRATRSPGHDRATTGVRTTSTLPEVPAGQRRPISKIEPRTGTD